MSPYEELIQMLSENKNIATVYYTIFSHKDPSQEDLQKAYEENPIVFEKLFGYKLKEYVVQNTG